MAYMNKLMARSRSRPGPAYWVDHRIISTYHPHTNIEPLLYLPKTRHVWRHGAVWWLQEMVSHVYNVLDCWSHKQKWTGFVVLVC